MIPQSCPNCGKKIPMSTVTDWGTEFCPADRACLEAIWGPDHEFLKILYPK